MLISDYLETKRGLIETRLDTLVPAINAPFKLLFDAARYSLFTPGKRIRPILTLAVAEMFGADDKIALDPACALELIHTYSMIHDDLPCMDNDDFRRGQPTLHKVYPEAIAVLAGDFLLTHAFQILATTPGLHDSQKLELIRLLTESIGGEGMIAGQMMDIASENKTISYETLQLIHQNKTGKLITCAIEYGSIIGNASLEKNQALREYGRCIGLAFQIMDDVFDVTKSEIKHGKKTSSDSENNKATYVTLLGIEKAKTEAFTLVETAKSCLENFHEDTTFLHEIADFVIGRQT